MQTSRIPNFASKSRYGMTIWFAEMGLRGLLFHPDDPPASISEIRTGKRSFSPLECIKLEGILAEMFEQFGDEVYEAAWPAFARCMGIRLAA